MDDKGFEKCIHQYDEWQRKEEKKKRNIFYFFEFCEDKNEKFVPGEIYMVKMYVLIRKSNPKSLRIGIINDRDLDKTIGKRYESMNHRKSMNTDIGEIEIVQWNNHPRKDTEKMPKEFQGSYEWHMRYEYFAVSTIIDRSSITMEYVLNKILTEIPTVEDGIRMYNDTELNGVIEESINNVSIGVTIPIRTIYRYLADYPVPSS